MAIGEQDYGSGMKPARWDWTQYSHDELVRTISSFREGYRENGNLLRAALARIVLLEKAVDVAEIYSGNIGHSRRCRQVQESHGLYQCFCRYEELRGALDAVRDYVIGEG